MEEDFHNYRKRLEAQIRILNEVNVSKANRQKILEYYNYIQTRGLSPSRIKMGTATFIQQNKTKNELVRMNSLLREQNQLLKEIRDLLELKR